MFRTAAASLQTAPYKSYRQPPAYLRGSPAGITYNLNNVCNAGVLPGHRLSACLRVSAEHAQTINYNPTLSQYIVVVNRHSGVFCISRQLQNEPDRYGAAVLTLFSSINRSSKFSSDCSICLIIPSVLLRGIVWKYHIKKFFQFFWIFL